MDNILEMRDLESETAPIETAEDTVLAVLFIARTAPPLELHEHVKRHRSSLTSEGENVRAMKKERTYLEAARRASLLDEKARQMRARELAGGASSS